MLQSLLFIVVALIIRMFNSAHALTMNNTVGEK